MPHIEQIRKLPFFSMLNAEQLERLTKASDTLTLSKNEIFIHERKKIHYLYFILSGSASVMKQNKKNQFSHITALKEGELIGEFCFLDNQGAASSVQTNETTELLVLDASILKQAKNQDLYQVIDSYIQTMISKRFRQNSFLIARDHYNIKIEKKIRYEILIFTISILCLSSFYTLLLPLLSQISQQPIESFFITIMTLSIFTITLYMSMKKIGVNMKERGFRLDNIRESIKKTIQYSMIFIVIITMIKWLAIFLQIVPPQPLIDPMQLYHQISEGYQSNKIALYIFSITLYAIFSFLQEFISRSIVQININKFINHRSKKYKYWPGILCTSLIFTASHTHLGLFAIISVFIFGLFLGWLFYRTKNLISVFISHMIIGFWTFFIMGYVLN